MVIAYHLPKVGVGLGDRNCMSVCNNGEPLKAIFSLNAARIAQKNAPRTPTTAQLVSGADFFFDARNGLGARFGAGVEDFVAIRFFSA